MPDTMRVTTFLRQRFHYSDRLYSTYLELWRSFEELGLPNQHFVEEITSGSQEKFYQRAWEMRLARHLSACGHVLSTSRQGPDFRFAVEDVPIWVEAISPSPSADMAEWMTPPAPNASTSGTVPHDQILLRYTAAFCEKRAKLRSYEKAGIVKDGDAYVIAIDGSQLSLIPMAHGASRLPHVVETVFGAGPLAFVVEDGRMAGMQHTSRPAMLNRNRALVETSAFLGGNHDSISAVIGCSPRDTEDPVLPLSVAYNPLSPTRLHLLRPFGACSEEWTAEQVAADAFDLVRL